MTVSFQAFFFFLSFPQWMVTSSLNNKATIKGSSENTAPWTSLPPPTSPPPQTDSQFLGYLYFYCFQALAPQKLTQSFPHKKPIGCKVLSTVYPKLFRRKLLPMLLFQADLQHTSKCRSCVSGQNWPLRCFQAAVNLFHSVHMPENQCPSSKIKKGETIWNAYPNEIPQQKNLP